MEKISKVFIGGNCGSGKSTAAKRMAKEYEIQYHSLDDFVWENNKKRSYDDRKHFLNIVLDNKKWIIEGPSHNEWMHEAYEKSDIIFLIRVKVIVCKYRVIKRFIKKKLGLEKGYKEKLKGIKNLLKLIDEYENNIIPSIKENLKKYDNKVYEVKNYKQMKDILDKVDK